MSAVDFITLLRIDGTTLESSVYDENYFKSYNSFSLKFMITQTNITDSKLISGLSTSP